MHKFLATSSFQHFLSDGYQKEKDQNVCLSENRTFSKKHQRNKKMKM